MMTKLLRPKYFIVGVLLGFLVCSIVGHIVSKKARFSHFRRSFLEISPYAFYNPTAHELLATAKHNNDKGKILVVLGGSSIFRGVGQNVDELWSDKLQSLLGKKYKVINFAMDGAFFTAFGAVAYRILNELYTKVIFVATCASYSEANIEGGIGLSAGSYGYLFWDAYYKNLLHTDSVEMKLIKKRRKQQLLTFPGLEIHLLSLLDSYFYFRNLWNWVSYRFADNVWSDFRGKPFTPIRHYAEAVDPTLKKTTAALFHNREVSAAEMKRLCTGYEIDKLLANHAEIYNNYLTAGLKNMQMAFTPRYRSKILCVQTTYNPALLRALPKNSREGYWLLTKMSHGIIKKSKYHVIDVGGDFKPEDYSDHTHFAASGGNKLAEQVATKIHAIAHANGFV